MTLSRWTIAAVIVLFASVNVAAAQPARNGFLPDLRAAAAVPRYAADPEAVSRALQAVPQSRSHSPMPFAVGTEIPLGLADGAWQETHDGTAIWRLRIASEGARYVSVGLSAFHVPNGAQLYFYDAAGSIVQGPFTAANETPEGLLSLPVVPGSEATLELRVPDSERQAVRLRVGRVYHAFRSLSSVEGGGTRASPITGDSAASCETNVVCAAGDDWRSPIRSTALIQIGDGANIQLCSGDLVNNARQDDTAYFLTAHHCGIGTSGFSASGVVIYWNYQAITCSGDSGSLADSQTGSVLESTDAGSDFTLIKLNQIPEGAFNVFYAGWDATSNIATSGVGIHHPVADIKKISTFSSPVSRQTIPITDGSGAVEANVTAWQVTWSSGITEEGSSGSGLWNQSSHIIGVLSGGNTECSSGVSSTGNDYYGRLEVAWTANASASGQLKAWLDPDNTGVLTLDGKDPGTATGGTSGSSTGGTSSGGTVPVTSSGGSSKSGAMGPWGFVGLACAAGWRRRRRSWSSRLCAEDAQTKPRRC